jgi:predicted transcriptional regulator with HTH domain
MGDKGEPDVGHVYRSLKNSKARNGVFGYLYNIGSITPQEPQKVSAKQISEKLGSSERAVLGALQGDGKRYKIEDSLVGMGLAAEYEENALGYPLKLFSITRAGLEMKGELEVFARNQGQPSE